jgi:putative peptidoglycan lipid II flippase
MLGRILTVGGFTFLSRLTGFARDIVLAAILGAGPIADAFFVALRLPNHFRAIFAEGAFNAAFVPAYARIREQQGGATVQLFADRIFTLMVATQIVLLVLALVFMHGVVAALAPGFTEDPSRFGLAVELTRITFPYLMLMTLVTIYSGILNALNRFAAAAAAPILLNLTMIVALALAAFFPSAGHAAAWGVLIAGCLEVLLVAADASRQGVAPRLRWPRLDQEVKLFLKRLAPATLGSAETQIALFADTIIASFLAAGALSALYYADRLNQLPIGVIGIAVGTVLLPEMANRLAAGDERGARHAQARAIELTLLLSVPCVVAFVLVPDLIMLALFGRGAFTVEAAHASAATLMAYAIGLFPFVLLRSMTATFLARGDTVTPVIALSGAVLVNVGLKLLLYRDYAQVGLAFATSIGAWVNVGLLTALALRRDLITTDRQLHGALVKLAGAGAALALALWVARPFALELARASPRFGHEIALALLAILGALVYGGLIAALFGRQWMEGLRRRKGPARPPPVGPPSA